ncbi:MAG TPA: DinB family protein [Cyclobacteriaceae bacterium]|jgi:uncharacterized damage-inducible protein DinB|nr:DinB family protein [Cyclobacteriaceae bacterium]
MKVIKVIFASLIFLSTISITQAQSIDDMVKEWERAKAYTKEYLDTNTEEGFALKPTPEMRSFAEQMLHLTDANYSFASAASGQTSPLTGSLEKTTTDKSKANVTKLVMSGYDYVIAAIKKTTPAQLTEKTKVFGQEMAKGMVYAKAFEHQTHHRGQTTVYLRLAKVTPPQEKLF